MFGIRKAISSIILTVIFLALASLAAFFYSSDKTTQSEMTSGLLIQKGKEVLGIVLGYSEKVNDSATEKNTTSGSNADSNANMITGDPVINESIGEIKDIALEITSSASPIINPNNESTGFFLKVIKGIKDEWQRIKEEKSYSDMVSAEIFKSKSEDTEEAPLLNESLE